MSFLCKNLKSHHPTTFIHVRELNQHWQINYTRIFPQLSVLFFIWQHSACCCWLAGCGHACIAVLSPISSAGEGPWCRSISKFSCFCQNLDNHRLQFLIMNNSEDKSLHFRYVPVLQHKCHLSFLLALLLTSCEIHTNASLGNTR